MSGAGTRYNNIVHILRDHAERRSSTVALTFLSDGESAGQRLTFMELDRRIRSVAGHLQSLQAAGQRALLLFDGDVDFVVAFLGCLFAQVVATPAYPPRSNSIHLQRLQAIAMDASAAFIITTRAIFGRIQEHSGALSGLARWLVIDDIDDTLGDVWQMPRLSGDTIAFLQYTSGSLGTPKGVMISHDNLFHNSIMIAKAFQHDSQAVHVTWLPLFHDMGLIGNVLQSLFLGTHCVFMSPAAFIQRPARWLRAISAYGGTAGAAPSSGYDLCVRKITDADLAGVDLSTWRVAYNGAEPVRSSVLDAFTARFAPYGFRRSSFCPCYGMAEATVFISSGDVSAEPVVRSVDAAALEQGLIAEQIPGHPARSLVSCGHAWLGQILRIVDPQTGTPCPPGEVGEIWLSGESVALGYWNRPEATAETFRACLPDSDQTFLRTGDVGFVDGGEVYITGRLKDLIIIRGRNHYPQDIEHTVERSSDVLRPGLGAAFAVDTPDGEALVVVHEVERVHLRKLDVDQVIRQILQAVSEEHELLVHAIVLLRTGSLPKTSSGKVQRSVCRDHFLAGSLHAVGRWTVPLAEPPPPSVPAETAAAPATEAWIRDWLVLRVASRLRIPASEIDTLEPLAHYGLESTLAVSLSDELGRKLGVRLEPLIFWEYPSIQELASFLATLPA